MEYEQCCQLTGIATGVRMDVDLNNRSFDPFHLRTQRHQ